MKNLLSNSAIRASMLKSGNIVASTTAPVFRARQVGESTAQAIASRRAELRIGAVIQKK